MALNLQKTSSEKFLAEAHAFPPIPVNAVQRYRWHSAFHATTYEPCELRPGVAQRVAAGAFTVMSGLVPFSLFEVALQTSMYGLSHQRIGQCARDWCAGNVPVAAFNACVQKWSQAAPRLLNQPIQGPTYGFCPQGSDPIAYGSTVGGSIGGLLFGIAGVGVGLGLVAPRALRGLDKCMAAQNVTATASDTDKTKLMAALITRARHGDLQMVQFLVEKLNVLTEDLAQAQEAFKAAVDNRHSHVALYLAGHLRESYKGNLAYAESVAMEAPFLEQLREMSRPDV